MISHSGKTNRVESGETKKKGQLTVLNKTMTFPSLGAIRALFFQTESGHV